MVEHKQKAHLAKKICFRVVRRSDVWICEPVPDSITAPPPPPPLPLNECASSVKENRVSKERLERLRSATHELGIFKRQYFPTDKGNGGINLLGDLPHNTRPSLELECYEAYEAVMLLKSPCCQNGFHHRCRC